MRIILTATAATLLLAQPAFAQNPSAGAARGSPQAGQSTPQMLNPPQAQNQQMISAKLQKSLQDAGFSDIHIMPSSFLVRAKDRDGNPVMMVINPDSVTAVTEIPGGLPSAAHSATPGGAGQVTIPSGQNSGAGVPGQPGNKSGPAVKSPTATTGSGANSNQRHNEEVREQDSAKIPGLPGSESGPTVKPPSR